MSYCAQCRCCLAQAGFTLCYFCEDGVPCPNKKKQIGKIGAEASKGATVPTVTENGQPRSNEESRSADGSQAVASSKNRQTPVPISPARRIMTARRISPQDFPFSPVRKRAASPGSLNTKKTSSKEKRMDMKKCRHPECKALIMHHNKSGCCAKHFHWGSKNPISSNGGKPQASPPNSASSKAENSSHAVATICVTEAHLNYFWSRLSLEEKAEIFTSQLRA